MGQPG